MNQREKVEHFHSLHTSHAPLVLYNIWDTGSATAVGAAGAKAIATSSWSMATAQGYEDGETLPLDFALMITKRIIESTELPVTVDFEGGYAEAPDEVSAHVAKLIRFGAVGINFEDQIVGTPDLYDKDFQSVRIRAIRDVADQMDTPLFINARTDLFLKAGEQADHRALLEEAKIRARTYAAAGANGFFAPALTNSDLIADLCKSCPIPVNIMMMEGVPSIAELADLGVSRISFGPNPYLDIMETMTKIATELPNH